MLDKLSKKILQYMNEQPQPSDVYYNFDEDLDEVAEAVASDSESVRSAVRYLHERKLIKFAYYNDSDIAACFYLDHKGLHYSLTSSKQRSVGKNACMALFPAFSFLCWQVS